MLTRITEHPEFWAVIGLSWGIASDLLAANPRIKANGVSQLVIALVSRAIAGEATNKRRR